ARVYVIVLDDLDIAPSRTMETRRRAREFVEKYFGAHDVAAVTYTSGRVDAVQDFTSDPQLLLNAINKFFGRRMRPSTLDKIDQAYQTAAMSATGANSDPAASDGSDSTDASSDQGTQQSNGYRPQDTDFNDFERI